MSYKISIVKGRRDGSLPFPKNYLEISYKQSHLGIEFSFSSSFSTPIETLVEILINTTKLLLKEQFSATIRKSQ